MEEMKVFKLFFNEEREEQWLNEMCAKGWHFKKWRAYKYTFEKGEPGEYTYRLDYLLKFGFGREVKEYIDFVEGTGAELVQKNFSWAYFRQHRDEGPFVLYSDTSSKLKFVNRLFAFYVTVILINILSIVMNGSLSLTEGDHSVHDFFTGMGTGVITVLIIPTILLYIRRTKLKKKTALFEM
jgi:hypothetical protein